jgi:hypothetical protein
VSIIDDLVDDASPKKSYYVEDSSSKITEGTYRAKVVALKTKHNVKTKTGVYCDIYWMRYSIDAEHPEFGGTEIRDSGLFRFKGNETQRNRFYKKFLETIGLPFKKIKQDGKIYYELPPLLDENVVGKIVQINIYENKWESASGIKREMVGKLMKVFD